MIDQKEEMNRLIKYFASICYQNPTIPFNKDTVYYELMNYGMSDEEIKNRNFSYELNSIKNFFNSNKKENSLNVYEHIRQPHFLQFQRIGDKRDMNPIKIYYNTSKENLKNVVKEVFRFIDLTGMESYSKVSDIIRSDSIVIRLSSVYDAMRVLSFIDNSDYIKAAARNTNPFLFRNGSVGMAYDHRTTYNGVTSEYISNYINHLKSNNKLNFASIDDFIDYLKNEYNDMFINCNEIDKVKNMYYYRQIRAGYNDISDGEIINNFEQVTKLLINICQCNMNINDYFNLYESTIAPSNYDKIKKYDEILNKREAINYGNENEDDDTLNLEDIVKDYILYAFEKYGSAKSVQSYLDIYLSGNIKGITRDNDFRKKFADHLSPVIVDNVTNGNSIEYINNTLVGLDESNEKDKKGYEVLCNSSIETLKKYGNEQLSAALKHGEEGNYGFFTDGGSNRFRNQLSTFVKPSRIKNYCMRYLIMSGMELDEIDLKNLEDLFSNQMFNNININTKSM